MLTVAWQAAGCAFMPLCMPLIPLGFFFGAYAALALLALPVVLWALADPGKLNDIVQDVDEPSPLRCVLDTLTDPKIWGYFATFWWCASLAAWGTSVTYIAAIGADAPFEETSELIALSPAIMMVSVLAPGIFGALVDRFGIARPTVGVLVLSAGYLVAVVSRVLAVQFFAILILGALLGVVYALQVVHLTERVPAAAFGPCLALTLAGQSVVQLAAVALVQPGGSGASGDLSFAATVWAVPLLPLLAWPAAEHFAARRRAGTGACASLEDGVYIAM
eukprot:NODE_5023_length_1818_cov_12.131283.p1 GENE.NODE_5023_length_1818_cov_12.131283~~NODE_5023_length_1818_cov_12.131283.p1  ORF type:complete len:289 (-),score=87.07 NODE_5023_length_1818_cov_12.131283:951-1781(-)